MVVFCGPLQAGFAEAFFEEKSMNELMFTGEDRRRIGEILVGAGKVEPMQLERGLSHQATVATRIGEILVTLGYVSEDDVVGALAEQMSI